LPHFFLAMPREHMICQVAGLSIPYPDSHSRKNLSADMGFYTF